MLVSIPSASRPLAGDAVSDDPAARLTDRLLGRARAARARRIAVESGPLRPAIRPEAAPGRTRGGAPVAILAGSAADLEALGPAAEVLRAFGVDHTAHVLDARRPGQAVQDLLAREEAKDVHVLIAASSDAPLLPGAVAATTLLPVLSAPVPVGAGDPSERAMAAAGAVNAALCAVRLLALRDGVLRERIERFDRAGATRRRRQLAGS